MLMHILKSRMLHGKYPQVFDFWCKRKGGKEMSQKKRLLRLLIDINGHSGGREVIAKMFYN